ncbi:MAG: ParB/RepB/Spo0J family partition protein [Clostridia bacterium]|nr:ParB/RepB/Spo0J family partition protein [Clostridia bacterium]
MSEKKIDTIVSGEIFDIPPYLIKPNPSLARTDFPDTSLVSLADSIRRYGILQPLAIRLSKNGRYELVAGERRLRAALLLEMATVPCVIIGDCGDFEYLSVVENIQREKLNMFDEARAIRRLFERSGRDIGKTSKLLSIGEYELCRKLRLCEFSRAEMQAILHLGISEQEALIYLDVPQSLRYYTIKLCAERGYSYSEASFLCSAIAEKNLLSPDELENFANKLLHPTAKESKKDKDSEPAKEQKQEDKKFTVVLRDLNSFEVSLKRHCKILESAGCKTSISIQKGGNKTTYTVTVETH